jgi:hypothetical protein
MFYGTLPLVVNLPEKEIKDDFRDHYCKRSFAKKVLFSTG